MFFLLFFHFTHGLAPRFSPAFSAVWLISRPLRMQQTPRTLQGGFSLRETVEALSFALWYPPEPEWTIFLSVRDPESATAGGWKDGL